MNEYWTKTFQRLDESLDSLVPGGRGSWEELVRQLETAHESIRNPRSFHQAEGWIRVVGDAFAAGIEAAQVHDLGGVRDAVDFARAHFR